MASDVDGEHDAGGAAGRPEEGYHLAEDLADRAIDYLRSTGWRRTSRSSSTSRPARATRRTTYRSGSDATRAPSRTAGIGSREITFARQKELEVRFPDAELTARPEGLPAWEEMAPELRPVLEHGMETYAAFLSHTDHYVGRVIEAIDELGCSRTADLLHLGRQRRIARGHDERHVQRVDRGQRV